MIEGSGRTSAIRIRIQEAQKHMDTTDTDPDPNPQHCFLLIWGITGTTYLV